MATQAGAVQGLQGFRPGTTAAEIRAFRDNHIEIEGTLDPQALQAWAQLERAALAAEANEIALRLNDGDIEGVRAEVQAINDTLFNISIDLALLFSKCEAVLNAPGQEEPVNDLARTVENLRKKFDSNGAHGKAMAAAASTSGEAEALSQADGAGELADPK